MRIYARGGGGGQGYLKLGGAGGDGGNVLIKAARGSSLRDIARREKRRFIGLTGGNSSRSQLRRKKGKDVVIKVPPGTVVIDDHGTEVYMCVLPITIQCIVICAA